MGSWNTLGCIHISVHGNTEARIMISNQIGGGQSSHCCEEDTTRVMMGFSDLTGFAVYWGQLTVLLILDVSQPWAKENCHVLQKDT